MRYTDLSIPRKAVQQTDLLHPVGHHVVTKGLCIILWRDPCEELNTHRASLLVGSGKLLWAQLRLKCDVTSVFILTSIPEWEVEDSWTQWLLEAPATPEAWNQEFKSSLGSMWRPHFKFMITIMSIIIIASVCVWVSVSTLKLSYCMCYGGQRTTFKALFSLSTLLREPLLLFLLPLPMPGKLTG